MSVTEKMLYIMIEKDEEKRNALIDRLTINELRLAVRAMCKTVLEQKDS